MENRQQIRDYILGLSSKFQMEELFIITLTFVALLMSVFGTLCNILIGLSRTLIIVNAIGSIWFAFAYYIARFKRRYLLSQLIVIVGMEALINIMWFNNAGSLGPMSLVFVASFSVFLFLWDGWKRMLFIIGFVCNFIILLLIEFIYPNIITPYSTREDRLIDISTGFVLYISLSAALMIYIKKLYTSEKVKAIASEKLKAAFLANLSHEIRTPMNGIIGFAEMLNTQELTEDKRKRYTKAIMDSSYRLLATITDVLDISQLESGQVSISKDFVNIEFLTLKLFQVYEPKASEKA